jgi:hypothetical protein
LRLLHLPRLRRGKGIDSVCPTMSDKIALLILCARIGFNPPR